MSIQYSTELNADNYENDTFNRNGAENEPPDPVITTNIPTEPNINGVGMIRVYMYTIIYEIVFGFFVLFFLIILAAAVGDENLLMHCLHPPMCWLFSGFLLWALRNQTSKRVTYSMIFMVWKVIRVAISSCVGIFMWTQMSVGGVGNPILVVAAIFFPLDALLGMFTIFVSSTANKYLALLTPPDRDPPMIFTNKCLRCNCIVPQLLLILVTVELIWRWMCIVQAMFMVARYGDRAFEAEVFADFAALPTLLAMYAVLIYGKNSKWVMPYLIYKIIEVSISFLLLVFCSYMTHEVLHTFRKREYMAMSIKFALEVAFAAPCLYAVIEYRKWLIQNEISSRAFQFSRMRENDIDNIRNNSNVA